MIPYYSNIVRNLNCLVAHEGALCTLILGDKLPDISVGSFLKNVRTVVTGLSSQPGGHHTKSVAMLITGSAFAWNIMIV